MNKALAVAESSTLGLMALITGTSPPEVVRELLLPPLDFDMPEPVAHTNSEPSTTRLPPHHFQTLPADPALSRNETKTPPSAGPGAYDSTVIPPSHNARTLILCFDGTGDQFDSDVGLLSIPCGAPSPSCGFSSQNSNIVQLFAMLKKDDKSQQVVYYQVRGDAFTFIMRNGGSNSAF